MKEQDVRLWSPEEKSIINEFGGRCARDGKIVVVLHEITPKSLRPKTWQEPMNRIPLCVDCHLWAHSHGTKRSRQELTELRTNSKYRITK
jgi:5-methylcytosine-specific restriction endonuclease McrA